MLLRVVAADGAANSTVIACRVFTAVVREIVGQPILLDEQPRIHVASTVDRDWDYLAHVLADRWQFGRNNRLLDDKMAGCRLIRINVE